jgi:hypothetical protein
MAAVGLIAGLWTYSAATLSSEHRRPEVNGYLALRAERLGGIPLALLAPGLGTAPGYLGGDIGG